MTRSQPRIQIGQIVRDRSRALLRGAAIVVGATKTRQFRICRWRGGQQHWSLPVAIGEEQLETIVDWTQLPLVEAKRLASAAFERIYLSRAMEAAHGSTMNAAQAAGVDRSNFRRLLQRHGLIKMSPPLKRRKTRKARSR